MFYLLNSYSTDSAAGVPFLRPLSHIVFATATFFHNSVISRIPSNPGDLLIVLFIFVNFSSLNSIRMSFVSDYALVVAKYISPLTIFRRRGPEDPAHWFTWVYTYVLFIYLQCPLPQRGRVVARYDARYHGCSMPGLPRDLFSMVVSDLRCKQGVNRPTYLVITLVLITKKIIFDIVIVCRVCV